MHASCERVFRPALDGRPVVELSNNDGACIARSNEAEDLGVQMARRIARGRAAPEAENGSRRQQRHEPRMAYPPEFLALVDRFIHLANELAGGDKGGEVSAAILFAAGRYNAFNFVSTGGTDDTRPQAEDFYVSEYRKAFVSNLDGVVGPVVRPQG